MELGELIHRLRRDVLDDLVTPYLWSDEALTDFFNDAVRQVCLRARALVDSTTNVTEYPVVAGQRAIKLKPSIIAVRMARLKDGCSAPLTGMTAKRMWKIDASWDVDTDGRPHHYIPDYQDGWLYLDRPVKTDGTLQLSVWRMPIDDEVMEMDSDEPVISEHWHQDLIDWAAFMAYSVKDGELGDEERASKHAAAFGAKVGRLPSMTEARLWGISPIVGVPAEFI